MIDTKLCNEGKKIIAINQLRASTHYALFCSSLVISCYHVLLVVYYSGIIFFQFLLKLYNLQQHENTKLQPITESFQHPGGEEIILENAGEDCSEAFEDASHSNDAKEMLKDFFIGHLAEVSTAAENYLYRGKGMVPHVQLSINCGLGRFRKNKFFCTNNQFFSRLMTAQWQSPSP